MLPTAPSARILGNVDARSHPALETHMALRATPEDKRTDSLFSTPRLVELHTAERNVEAGTPRLSKAGWTRSGRGGWSRPRSAPIIV